MTKQYGLVVKHCAHEISVYLVGKKSKILSYQTEQLSSIDSENAYEYNPEEWIFAIRSLIHRLMEREKVSPEQVKGISLVNTPSSFLLWDKSSGEPLTSIYDRGDMRCEGLCQVLRQNSMGREIKKRSCSSIYPNFSGPKLRWLAERNPEFKALLEKESTCFGTLDTWLIWHLTGQKVFQTDSSNAQETLFFSPLTQTWDYFLASEFGLSLAQLPTVVHQCEGLQTSGFLPFEDGTPIVASMTSGMAGVLAQGGGRLGVGCLQFRGDMGQLFFPVTKDSCSKLESVDLVMQLGSVGGAHLYGLEACFPSLKTLYNSLSQFLKEDKKLLAKVVGYDTTLKEMVVPKLHKPLVMGMVPELSFSILGLSSETDNERLTLAMIASLAHQLKIVLLDLEQRLNCRLKELHISGEFAKYDGVMQLLSDILQVSLQSYAFEEPEVMGVSHFLEDVIESEGASQKSSQKVKTILPNLDPLTSYSIHETWFQQYTSLNRAVVMTQQSLF
ncbi:hypothetical protein DID77_00270 [Candidatus Marinamargulisbacteria bacterium SCGC AG-439-L15]|nr:hypothetical protein DID77_00270 [Candidatus Marinamargulisbacteria bacterium SCGC AG-439-L15]